VRLRPERVNHVWSYDFVQGHTYCPWTRRWRKFRVLVIIDEYSRECLALYVARHIKALDVIDVLSELMLERGVPEFIRSDNEPEFVASVLRNWLKSLGTQRSGSVKLNRLDKCIIGGFGLGKGAGAGDLYEQIIRAAQPPRV
jgi:putative transposase